jgi:hypothetical protein
MHSVQSDNALFNWAVAGTAQADVSHGDPEIVHDQRLDLVDRYQIYLETPSNWYHLEKEEAWYGQSHNLCGSHKIEWLDSNRNSVCKNLTQLLQTMAASMMPWERSSCRHAMGSCVTSVIETPTGSICQHSLAIEMSHPFHTAANHRLTEPRCFADLGNRLLLAGIPIIGSAFDPDTAL